MGTEYKNDFKIDADLENFEEFIPAVKLLNNADGSCTFVKGRLPTLKHIPSTKFWFSTKTEEWEKNAHVAPRKQYVITIKGNIKFKVSNGSTFMIEPGIILLAEDLKGDGHSWEMVDSKEWERLYIPMTEDGEDLFIPDPE
nr:hypothetical protein [uncultured Chryseobacterium sp.]